MGILRARISHNPGIPPKKRRKLPVVRTPQGVVFHPKPITKAYGHSLDVLGGVHIKTSKGVTIDPFDLSFGFFLSSDYPQTLKQIGYKYAYVFFNEHVGPRAVRLGLDARGHLSMGAIWPFDPARSGSAQASEFLKVLTTPVEGVGLTYRRKHLPLNLYELPPTLWIEDGTTLDPVALAEEVASFCEALAEFGEIKPPILAMRPELAVQVVSAIPELGEFPLWLLSPSRDEEGTPSVPQGWPGVVIAEKQAETEVAGETVGTSEKFIRTPGPVGKGIPYVKGATIFTFFALAGVVYLLTRTKRGEGAATPQRAHPVSATLRPPSF